MPLNGLQENSSNINKLLLFISQTSENYGKLLTLIQSMETSLREIPDARDLKEVKEKIGELKENISGLKRNFEENVETSQKIKETITYININAEAANKLLTKIDSYDFSEHMRQVEEMKKVICGYDYSAEIHESTEILRKFEKIRTSIIDKKKILIGVVGALFIIYQIWDKLIHFITHILTPIK